MLCIILIATIFVLLVQRKTQNQLVFSGSHEQTSNTNDYQIKESPHSQTDRMLYSLYFVVLLFGAIGLIAFMTNQFPGFSIVEYHVVE